MTVVPPTLQKPNPPSLEEVLYAFERMLLKKINCVRPGVVVEFNPGNDSFGPTATVDIAQNQVTSEAPDGTRTIAPFPQIVSAPVWFFGGGGLTITAPIKKGDECILLFNDRELDNWLLSGAGTAPTTSRLHNLSDAFVLVGLRSNARAIGNISTTTLQIRNDAGDFYFEMDEPNRAFNFIGGTINCEDIVSTGNITGDVNGRNIDLLNHKHVNSGGTGDSGIPKDGT